MKIRMIGWLAAALLSMPILANAQKSCAVSPPGNGNLGNCPGSLSSGSSCSVSCNTGYTLVGSVTSCTNGNLTATQTCAANACVVSAPANGSRGTCASVISSGSSCEFTCNSGFILTGSATSCSAGVLTAQSCQAGGSGNGGDSDGPLPLWALGALGAGLLGIASRRLKKAA